MTRVPYVATQPLLGVVWLTDNLDDRISQALAAKLCTSVEVLTHLQPEGSTMKPTRSQYVVKAVTLFEAIDDTHAVEVIEADSDRVWHVRLDYRDTRRLAVYRFRGVPGEYDRDQLPADFARRDFIVYPVTRDDLTKRGRVVDVAAWPPPGA